MQVSREISLLHVLRVQMAFLQTFIPNMID